MTDFSKIKKLFNLNSPNGFSENEIADMLSLVPILPEPLLDYYRELGNYDFNYWQDRLIKPNQYKDFANDQYVIICCENQGCCFAGIKKTDLSQKNPPVYFSIDESHWEIGCGNLIDYIHGFAYSQAALGLPYGGCIDTIYDDNDIEYIRNNFKSKGILFRNWLVDGDMEIYGGYDDTIMLLIAETSLFFASNSEVHYNETANKLNQIS